MSNQPNDLATAVENLKATVAAETPFRQILQAAEWCVAKLAAVLPAPRQ